MPISEKSALDWYEEGKEARLCRKTKEDNPYPAGEASHDAWTAGWEAVDDPANERAKGYS